MVFKCMYGTQYINIGYTHAQHTILFYWIYTWLRAIVQSCRVIYLLFAVLSSLVSLFFAIHCLSMVSKFFCHYSRCCCLDMHYNSFFSRYCHHRFSLECIVQSQSHPFHFEPFQPFLQLPISYAR